MPLKRLFPIFIVCLFLSFLYSAWGADEYTTTSGRSRVTVTSKNTTKKTSAKKTVTTKKTSRHTSKRTKSAPSKSSRGRSKGGKIQHIGSNFQAPQFKIRADTNLPILYFYPADRKVVLGGEPFSTLVILSNPAGKSIDRICLAIKYDPAVLKPVQYEDKLPEDLLVGASKTMVYPSVGIIVYKAIMKKPITLPQDELIAIYWEALVPQENSIITFGSFDGQDSGIYLHQTNILGEPGLTEDGIIPSNITILRKPPELDLEYYEEEDEEDFMTEDFSARLVVDNVLTSMQGGDGSVELMLKAPEGLIRQGDVFNVDIYFRNPNAANMDNVTLDIRFDPEALQVVDYDEENWITREVNIFDGEYHDKFPFDYHLKNHAFNTNGRILYKMGISSSDRLINEGKMATIKFYAMKPVEKTMVRFYRNVKKREIDGTSLTYAGNDVLGTITDRFKGLSNANISILPEN